MDRIFQIVAVFILLTLFIHRWVKGRETRFRPYDFIRRMKPPLPEGVGERLIAAVPGAPEGLAEGRVDLFIVHDGLVFCYGAEGRLTIYRQDGDKYRQRQELAVPLDCIAMALDPADENLYLEAGGFIFIYG